MSCAKKFLVLVATAMAVLIALAAFEYYQSERIYRVTRSTSANTIPSIATLDKAYSNLVAIRVQVWHIITENDVARMTDIAQMIDEETASIDMSLNQYEALYISDDIDRKLLANEREKLLAYKKLRTQAIQLSMAGMSRNARDLIIANQHLVNGTIAAIEQHRHYNVALANKAAAEAKGLKASITALSTCILIAGLLVIAWLGFLMLQLLREVAAKLDTASLLVNTSAILSKHTTSASLRATFLRAANDSRL